MRKIYLLTLILALVLGSRSYAQDFSNKGKEFWLCFPTHVPSTTLATLSIWITSDKASSGTITMPNGAFSATFNIPANGLQEIPIPHNINRHIANNESNIILNKSIHIKVDAGKPAVVAYAQQWGAARSAATLLLPVTVLGKKYFAMSFSQNGANNGTYLARSQFQVIATNDNTVIKITPMKNGSPDPPITVTLPLAGDMYQYQSTDGAAASQDLTGTIIESTASPSGGCLPIAVFSGSSNNTFGTTFCSGNSYDPLWQQCYPVTTWGKNFGLIPFRDYSMGVPYRVMASEDNTKVLFDGVHVATLNAGQIYPSYYGSNPSTTTAPINITSDKPICVAEFAQADLCTSGSGVGDPDMVILNPIEQNIKDITIFSSTQQAISRQYINVLLKTIATPSFTINGVVPGTAWQTFPTLPGYSYLRHQLPGSGSYRLAADSGFNAICYGWGNVESYSYSAGTNIRDLYQQTGVASQYGIETAAAICVGTPFKFKLSLPYCAQDITWDLSGLPTPPPPPPTVTYSTCVVGPGGPDSTTTVNGVTLYWYSLPSTYSVTPAGSYPISIVTHSSVLTTCGSENQIDFDLNVYDPPATDFTHSTPACIAVPVTFADNSITPRPSYMWFWDFGDPGSGANNTSTLENPTHLFTTPGNHTVSFYTITTPGCVGSPKQKIINVPDLPTGVIAGPTNVCLNSTANITFTGADGTAPYTFFYHASTAPTVALSVNSATTTATAPVNTTVVGPITYTLDSVRNVATAVCVRIITGQSVTINVQGNATATLSSAPGSNNQSVCINNAITNITYAIGGSGTGAAIFSGSFPPGVTGSFSGGVYTITGTPTSVGSFNYTIQTAGPCTNADVSGTIIVTGGGTLILASPPPTAAQSVCVNTAIATISYAVGGSGTGASITAGTLPAGITGTYSAGTFTITGTPTATGTFGFTISASGPCTNNSLLASITVNSNSTLSLSSVPGSNNQTICINTAIATITYAVGGSATGASVTAGGLPTGVTGTYSGGVFTISGTPTVSGTFPFTVGTTGPCSNPTLSGILTVNPNASLNLTSAAGTNIQTVCLGNAVTNITYAIGGGGTGASITAGALPAGVTGTYSAGVFTITGTPSASGVFNFTVGTTGPCVNTSLTGTLTVTGNATLSLSSAPGSNTQTVCINTAIATVTYAVGGSATNASITAGGLPAGVTGTYSGGNFTISGTPTVSGTFPFTVGTAGPCGTPSLTGTITVTPNSTLNLTSPAGSNTQTVCLGNAVNTITYTIGGGATGALITSGGLPTGVTGTFSAGVFTISGTPTASGTFSFTVGTTGPCVNTSLNGTLTVTGNATLSLSSAPGSNTQTVCVNTAITTITYAVGGSATTVAITGGGLPTGVTGTYSGGNFTISGTPTVSGTFPFTVGTGGPCGTPSLTGTLTVTANSTLNLTSPAGSNTQTLCVNTTITNISYSIGGGATSASLTAGAFPPGVNGTYSSGVFVISGIPSTAGVYNYTIGTAGPCANTTLSGTITVTNNATLSLSSPAGSNTQTVCVNNAIATITYAVGGSATNASITGGGLPAGVTGTFSGGNFTISGTPTVSGTFPFTVGTASPCGTQSLSGTLTVTANSTLNLTSPAGSNLQTVCVNTTITNISYSVGGGGTGASITAGALPPGVNGTYSSGVFVVSGSPSTAGVYNFTIGTAGPCVNTSLSGTITVTADATLSLSSGAGSNTQTICINNAIATITYAVGGSATNASITAGGLPTGVTGVYSGGVFTISGTPTTSGSFPFTVGTTGPCVAPSLTGTITVNADHSITRTSPAPTTSQNVCVNTAITPITYTLGGGATGANVSVTLPAGVTSSVSGTTVTISGTPTATGSFNYIINTSGNSCVGASATGSINVTPAHALTLSSGAGTDNQTVCVNNAITSISYTLSGGANSATVSSLPAGLTGTVSGSTFTISGTPTVSGPAATYTITTSGNSCAIATITGTITVESDHVITLNSAASTVNQTVCSDRQMIPITYALTGGATGAVVTGLPPGITSSVSGSVLTISGAPTSIAGSPFSYSILTSGNGCVKATAAGTITVLLTPTVQFNAVPGICQDVPAFQVNALPATGIFSGTGINAAGMFNPAVAGAGDHTIRYTYTAGNGCSNFQEQKIAVYPLPVVDAGPDRGMIEGGQITLMPIITANFPVTYAWTPAQYITKPDVANAVISSIPDDMTFTLLVTSDHGCSATDKVFVKLLRKVEIPNIFSPNGDGVHDTWTIQYLESYPGCTVDIFNRYGQRIYHTEGYTKPWDGTVNGKPVAVGTYYYIVNPKNGRSQMSGYVDVIR